MFTVSRQRSIATVVMLLVIGATGKIWAQTPSITKVVPGAVSPGSSSDLTLRGEHLDGAVDLWMSFSGQASPVSGGNGSPGNPKECVYRVTVPAEVSPGIHAIRVATARGVSDLKFLLVDDLPSVRQTRENTTEAAAQALTLPCAVDGTVANLTRNYYKFQVSAGQRVSFEIFARRLGTPLDPMLRLLDSQGRELTYSDDTPGLNGDAQICYTFQEAGEYLIEVRDIRYNGGGNYDYRLRVGDFPCVQVPYPMGVRRGTETAVNFMGTAGEATLPARVKIPADVKSEWLAVATRRPGGVSRGFAVVHLGNRNEFLEAEPNDTPDQANRVGLGANLNGVIATPAEVDHFVFPASKGAKYSFVGITRRQGAPTSLSMRLLNPEGNQVAAAQDFGTSDATIDYTFPADGDYTLEVTDLHRRGGPQFAYHVRVNRSPKGFTLEVSDSEINIPANGVAMLTVTAARFGYNGPIGIEAVDLPAGLTSTPTVIGPGRNSVVLTLRGDAAAGKIFPIRIVGKAEVDGQPFQTEASTFGALKSAMNAVAWPPAMLTKSIAAALAPRPPFRLQLEPSEVVFGRNLSAKVKVIAKRDEGYNEAIELAITPEKGGLPDGISAALKPIPQGESEVEIVLSANDKAPLGQFTGVLVGTHKKDKQTVTQPAPGLLYKLEAPFTLNVDVGAGKLSRGGELTVKITAQRNPAFAGPIAITFHDLPEGVSAVEATIPAEASETTVRLSAAEDAKSGAANKVKAKGDATSGEAKLSEMSPAVSLTVE